MGLMYNISHINDVNFENKIMNKKDYLKKWLKNNPEKRKAIQKRYEISKGIGIDYPCKYCNKMAKRKGNPHFCSDICRFMDKIEKTETCWNWKGKITNSGYGEFRLSNGHKLAHRYSYEHFKGKIFQKNQVCHFCDNKKCVNPDHLWIGTAKDNIQDAKKKGRLPNKKGISNIKLRGENHPKAKLTEKQVREILKIYKQTKQRRPLARKYNVSKSTIDSIVDGRLWKNINT